MSTRKITAVELVRDALELVRRQATTAAEEGEVIGRSGQSRVARVERLRMRKDSVASFEGSQLDGVIQEFNDRLEESEAEAAACMAAITDLEKVGDLAKSPTWRPAVGSGAAEGFRRLFDELERRVAEGPPPSTGAFPLAAKQLFEHRRASLVALQSMGFRPGGARRSLKP
jgi:hypothetical protein